MVLLIFFFLLLCIALPLGEVSRITIGLNVSFTLLDVLVTLGSIVWLLAQIKKHHEKISLQARSLWLVIGVFALSLLVNILTLSELQFLTAGLYIVRFLCFGLLFFMVKNANLMTRKNIEKLLFLGGSLLVAGGYAQYFLYPSLRNLIYFGWDEHFYRMFGTFFDPNFFGLFLVLFFIFIVAHLFTLKPSIEKIQFSVLFLLASATCIAIFLTYSRTALIVLTCGIFILLWNKKYWKWFWVFLFALGMGALALFFLSTQTKDVNSIFRTVSTDARIGSAKNAVKIFTDHPILGVGFNAYRYAQYRYHFMVSTPIQEDHGASGADSSLLLVLATSGIVGFAAFCLFLSSHFLSITKQRSKVGLATFVAFFIGSFFVNGLFYPLLLFWVWTVLGITESDGQ